MRAHILDGSCLLLSLLLSMAVHAQQGGSVIGTMITTKGTVLARDPAGATRQLARRSQIFLRDTIIVCADGFAIVRMIDDAQIAFRSDTEFTFEAYDFDGNTLTPDHAVMSLSKGGFRSITGSIGTEAHDEYRVDTPPGSINHRGTVYAAVLEEGVLYTAAYEGGITVSNAVGHLDVGIGSDYDFSRTLPGLLAEGLLDAPSALKTENFSSGESSSPSPAPSTPAACLPGP